MWHEPPTPGTQTTRSGSPLRIVFYNTCETGKV